MWSFLTFPCHVNLVIPQNLFSFPVTKTRSQLNRKPKSVNLMKLWDIRRGSNSQQQERCSLSYCSNCSRLENSYATKTIMGLANSNPCLREALTNTHRVYFPNWGQCFVDKGFSGFLSYIFRTSFSFWWRGQSASFEIITDKLIDLTSC